MLLESLQPPHQNYTSFLHTQMDKIKLKRQLIFTSPTLNNAKYLILEVKQVMVSLLFLNLDFLANKCKFSSDIPRHVHVTIGIQYERHFG